MSKSSEKKSKKPSGHLDGLTKGGEFISDFAQAGVGLVDGLKSSLPSGSTAQNFFKAAGDVAEAVAPFLPLVALVGTLTKEIIEAYENVQYNKKTCGALVNRVEAADTSIKALMRQKDENLKNFRDQDYYQTFVRFTNCLKQIKKFFDDVSQLPKFKKFVSSANIREKLEENIKEFNNCSNDLNLAISIATKDQLDKDLAILQEDMIEMNKFLHKIEGGITTTVTNTEEIMNKLEIQNNEIKIIVETVIEQNKRLMEMNEKLDEDKKENKTIKFNPLNRVIDTINLLNKQVNEQDSTIIVRAKEIKASELLDPPRYVPPRQGSRVKIQKKVYNSMEVACKPISVDDIQRTQKHLAILEKLDACPYIIKFHGLSEIATERVMVFEWAELGNLKSVYQQFKIDWEAKISIARDICRGLAFLQSVKILHHDIRCENVLINENIQPKLTNFKFAREFHANTTQIDDINALIHWLAPEKLSHISQDKKSKKTEEARYTIQCEIFSFGMLLWELAFQKIPYEGKSMLEVQKHVLKGNRETLDFGGLNPHPIQREFAEIIKLAWQQEQSLRPGIQLLFNMLQESYEKNVLANKGSPLMRPLKEKDNPNDGTTGDEELDGLCLSDSEEQNEPFPIIVPLIPVKEGLQAHKEGNYQKAWECFEANANVGDILAIYWQGYYYLEGKHVVKNKQKAMELFRKAADAGNADAQLRYAFCLIDKENKNIDSNKFMKYLQLAADNNNATALYNLGDVYFSGKLGIKKDKDKGVHYLRQAALHKQTKAKEILEKHGYSIC